MPTDDHLRTEQYVETRQGRQARSTLALRLHDHLLCVCPDCRTAWEQLDVDQEAVRELLRTGAVEAKPEPDGEPPDDEGGSAVAEEVPAHHLPGFLEDVDELREEIFRLRRLRRKVRKQVWELERQTPEERVETITKARTRFRSPALAEQIIELVRERVRSDPRDAENLASLVPRILHWTPDGTDAVWITELVHRANAWRANALRVAGDLPAADRAFAALRRDLAREPVEDLRVQAEAAGLEAALRIDQRRSAEAKGLLDRALLLFRQAGDEVGIARTLLQKARMFREIEEPEDALACMDEAWSLMPVDRTDSYEQLVAINGRITLLMGLERYREAEKVLDEHIDVYERSTDLNIGPLIRNLRGLIYLGLNKPTEAANELRASVEGLVSLGRAFDAALVALDLARAYLAQGEVSALRPLASQLIAMFQAQGVEREAVAALKLFASAVAGDQLTSELLSSVRSTMERHPLNKRGYLR